MAGQVPGDPDGADAEPLVALQVAARILDEDGVRQARVRRAHRPAQHRGVGLRAPCAAIAHLLDRDHALEQAVDLQLAQHRARIGFGGVRQHDLAAGQRSDEPREPALGAHHRRQVGERVDDLQEIVRIDRVMAREAEERRAVAARVVGAQMIGVRALDFQRIDDVLRHRPVDRREDRMRRVVQRVVEIEEPDGAARLRAGAPPARSLGRLLARRRRGGAARLAARAQCERIIVPNGCSVRISSSTECSMRPSTIWTDFTPLFAASSADEIFGSMPPEIVPSSKSASISRADRSVSRLPSLSITPGMLVIITSFSAFSTVASLPATRSALMLYDRPSSPKPIGEITGMNASSCSAFTTAGLIASTSPTWPMSTYSPGLSRSGIISLRAWMRPPSLPVRPTAWPPKWLISVTMSCCTSPPSTHSTTSIVSSSVTRIP
ncbi:hypothetical protein BURPS1710b_0379 [Burkholderia pseudomallei 1710b]|uniref:Uncharacterized protein n=1 Tax=Burkholderia pseudomallei (strain 1710b) TaxID=320372 RepID=Q3JXB0_BURP1|nr:hypothetical protein BURPS1710b_0379 [Burkholderia pseudomallei 1710b]